MYPITMLGMYTVDILTLALDGSGRSALIPSAYPMWKTPGNNWVVDG
jgi:hypothetical protein